MISMLNIKRLTKHYAVEDITVLFMGSHFQTVHIKHKWFPIKSAKHMILQDMPTI
jgi:hypothetical protein